MCRSNSADLLAGLCFCTCVFVYVCVRISGDQGYSRFFSFWPERQEILMTSCRRG